MDKSIIVVIAIIMLAIISSPVLSESFDEFYADKQYVKLTLNISSGVEMKKTSNNYIIEEVNVRLMFFPRNTFMQTVKPIKTDPKATITSNEILFEWNKLNVQDLEYSYQSDVTIYNSIKKVKSKVRYPITTQLDSSVQQYLEPSKNIDSDNPSVVQTASNIAAGENDLYVLVDKLAAWTKSNIKYNLSSQTADVSQTASWTLKNKQGVCDELTALLIGMCRSLGIPARFVTGIAYTNSELFDERWGPHGWAEIYFPGTGWVPYDPTYGQIGFIDPGHIVMKISEDPDDSTSKFEWKVLNVEVTPENDLGIKTGVYETGPKIAPIVKLTGDVYRSIITPGSYQIVETTIENLQDFYVSTTLYLSKPEEVTIIKEPATSIPLGPKEKKTVYWIVKVNENLQNNYVYTFPISIYSSRNESFNTQFKAQSGGNHLTKTQAEEIYYQSIEADTKQYSTNVDFSCYPEKDRLYMGESSKVICELQNTGTKPLEDVKICMEQDCRTRNIALNQKITNEFEFKANSTGSVSKTIIARNKDFSKVATVDHIVQDYPKINIIDIKYPQTVNYDEKFSFGFTLEKSTKSIPMNVSVMLKLKDSDNEWEISEMQVNQDFLIDINSKSLDMGSNDIEIMVEYYDVNGKKYVEFQEVSIELQVDSFSKKMMAWMYTANRKIAGFFKSIFS